MITLIGKELAKKNLEFIYLGPSQECRDCKLRNACLNLEAGRRYKIKAVRETSHECKIHEGGVKAVEVERVPITAALPAGMAVEGSTIKFSPADCGNIGCSHYTLCSPPGIKPGTKYKILKINGDVKCPEGKSLKSVLLD